jgi:hypothetical protein
MLHGHYVIYSVQYYPQFHITAVVLGTYYPWIQGHYCMYMYTYIHTHTHIYIYYPVTFANYVSS